jgi:anti-sigma B factor antagonist
MSDAPEATPFTIEKRDVAVIARPELSMIDEDELKTLIQLIDQSAGPNSGITLVVLDLSRIRMLPSLTLGLLVQLSKKCKARQQKLKLAAMQPQVRQVFSITRLDRVFDLSPSVESALQ